MKKIENIMDCAKGKIQKEICSDLSENDEAILPHHYKLSFDFINRLERYYENFWDGEFNQPTPYVKNGKITIKNNYDFT